MDAGRRQETSGLESKDLFQIAQAVDTVTAFAYYTGSPSPNFYSHPRVTWRGPGDTCTHSGLSSRRGTGIFYIGHKLCLPMSWRKSISSMGVDKPTVCFAERYSIFQGCLLIQACLQRQSAVMAACTSAHVMCRTGRLMGNCLLTDYSLSSLALTPYSSCSNSRWFQYSVFMGRILLVPWCLQTWNSSWLYFCPLFHLAHF